MVRKITNIKSIQLEELLEKESIMKLLIKYSIPSIIGMLVSALYNVVDRIFIGNIKDIGAIAITGIGVTLPFTTILIAFNMLLGVGATANISIKLGKGERKSAELIIGNSLSLSILLGAILTLVGFIFCDEILMIFGASLESLVYAREYMRIILLGNIFNIAGHVLNSTIRTDGSPKAAAIIMILSCLLNFILDPLFIFKFNMGISGAAYATVLSQILTLFLSLKYYLSHHSSLKIKKENLKINLKIIKVIMSIGFSPFIMQIATCIIQVVNNNVLKNYGGDYAIGAMATINGIFLLCLMPVFGITQGAQPIIGYNYGAKNYKRVKETHDKSRNAGVVLLALAFIVIQIFPEWIIRTFTTDPLIGDIAISGLRIYTLFMPMIAVGMIGCQFFQAIGKAKVALFLSLLRQVVLLLPILFVFSKFFGVKGVWLAQCISDLFAASIIGYFAKKQFEKFREINSSGTIN